MSCDFFDISAVDKSLRLFRLVSLVAWCLTLDDRHDQNFEVNKGTQRFIFIQLRSHAMLYIKFPDR
jgi:hypothetical protein